jgi:hypothetical protein
MIDIKTYAQGVAKVQTIEAKSVPEAGCPVGLEGSEAELEIDPFNAPVAIRIYLTYRNNSTQQLAAVKFRARFLDEEGETRGNFQAYDEHPIPPGGTGSQKWRKEGIDPRTRKILVRVLQVKFIDATGWNSQKFQDQSGVTTGSSEQTPSVTPPIEQQTPPAITPSAAEQAPPAVTPPAVEQTPPAVTPPAELRAQPASPEPSSADENLKPRIEDPFTNSK